MVVYNLTATENIGPGNHQGPVRIGNHHGFYPLIRESSKNRGHFHLYIPAFGNNELAPAKNEDHLQVVLAGSEFCPGKINLGSPEDVGELPALELLRAFLGG